MGLDKFIDHCSHSKTPSITLKIPPMAHCSPVVLLSPVLDNHWSDFCPYAISFSRMSYRSVQYIAFWAWLLLLSIMQLRFAYVAVSVVPSFSLMSSWYSAVWMYHTLLSFLHLRPYSRQQNDSLVSRTCECLTFAYWQRDFADLVKVKDFEMGRLFWIMQVIPVIFPLSNLEGKKSRSKRCAWGDLVTGSWQPARQQGLWSSHIRELTAQMSKEWILP